MIWSAKMTRIHPSRLLGFLLYDRVRLIELLSAFNLLAWAMALASQPSLLSRDSYVTFQSLPAQVWVIIFCTAAALQLLGIFGYT